MRVTQTMMYRTSLAQLTLQKSRLAKTQEQATTGRRLNRASDDPVDFRSALKLKDALSQTGRFLRSIDLSRSRLDATEQAIADAQEVVSQAKVTAIQARNDSNGPSARAALRIQVEQLFDQLLDASNTRAAGGGYVFSGVASDQVSFVKTGTFASGSPQPTVAFAGDDAAVSVEIDDGVSIEVTRSGAKTFQGTVDLFDVLGRLWRGIDQDDDAAIGTAITELDQGLDQLSVERAAIGGSGNKADSIQTQLRAHEQNITQEVSTLEDADAYQVYSELAAQQSALQASLAVTAQINQPTLLDYL